ncbi:MAG: efflux RND transporter periplasmic adaptor subunit [Pseudomonadota bacterium]
MRLLIILLVLGVIGYFAYGALFAKPPLPPKPPAPKVAVQRITIADMPLTFDYAARLAGSREVEIRARVGGILQKRVYTEGQWVKRGDVLFMIDPAPYEAALADAQSRFEQADKDYKRAVSLRKDKSLSPREFEAAQSTYGQSKAAVDTAKINLAYTTVRAPISGFASEEGFSEGSLVAADTSLLTRLTQLDPMYVEFATPDMEAMQQRAAVAAGTMTLPADKTLKVEIRLSDGTVYPREGLVKFTDNIIDPTTGTVRVRAVVPNADHAILPGQFVRVVLKGLTQKNAIAVPEAAIMQGPMGTFVYRIDEAGKAQIAPVKLGLLNGQTRLIADGLNEGDSIITQGMIKVKPDSPVTVDTGEEKAPETPAPAKG